MAFATLDNRHGSRQRTHDRPSALVIGRWQVMSSFKDITDNNNRLVEHYKRLQRMAAQAASPGPGAVNANEARGVMKDEGMALVAQILLMSECEAFFGSYASNVRGLRLCQANSAVQCLRMCPAVFFACASPCVCAACSFAIYASCASSMPFQ